MQPNVLGHNGVVSIIVKSSCKCMANPFPLGIGHPV